MLPTTHRKDSQNDRTLFKGRIQTVFSFAYARTAKEGISGRKSLANRVLRVQVTVSKLSHDITDLGYEFRDLSLSFHIK